MSSATGRLWQNVRIFYAGEVLNAAFQAPETQAYTMTQVLSLTVSLRVAGDI